MRFNPHGASIPDPGSKRESLTHFLTFLSDIVSSIGEKEHMKSLTGKEIKKEDVSTGFATETFALILYPRSKAATGIESKRDYNLVEPQHIPRASVK
jgi:hypothetical protein